MPLFCEMDLAEAPALVDRMIEEELLKPLSSCRGSLNNQSSSARQAKGLYIVECFNANLMVLEMIDPPIGIDGAFSKYMFTDGATLILQGGR